MLQSSKRVFPFEGKNTTQPSKKYKAHSVSSVTNMHRQTASSNNDHLPLAEKMRPSSLSDYIGQKLVVGSDTLLQQLLTKGRIPSMVLWGPPGCGKSSLANVISCLCKERYGDKMHIVKLSAVTSGVSSIRDAVQSAKINSKSKQTIVFMDEIHRFNKLQQDIFLPHVEAGTFILIGTTAENPSYSLNSALLSRCRVFKLNKLTELDITEILCKAIEYVKGQICDLPNELYTTNMKPKFSCTSSAKFIISKTIIDWLAEVCDGDARVALSGLELAIKTKTGNGPSNLNNSIPTITLEDIKESLKQAHTLCDKQTNHSHHMYSALHKCIKAGNANAGLYWLARIMAVKEDPVDIARRLVRICSEDVGLADPDALGVAVHTMHGCQMIGMPECDVILGQCVVYLAKAPKSSLVYNALRACEKIILNHKGPQPSVPLHIRCRSGEAKLQNSIGRNGHNLLRKMDDVKSHLPPGLQHVNFFQEDY